MSDRTSLLFGAADVTLEGDVPGRHYFMDCRHARTVLTLARRTKDDDAEVMAQLIVRHREGVKEGDKVRCACQPLGWVPDREAPLFEPVEGEA